MKTEWIAEDLAQYREELQDWQLRRNRLQEEIQFARLTGDDQELKDLREDLKTVNAVNADLIAKIGRILRPV